MVGGKVVYGTSWLSNSYENSSRSGFSELEAFAQYQFLRNDRHAISARLSAGRPALLHPDAQNSSSQDGADIELAALYGSNVVRHPIKVFTAIETGYRKRIGSSADIIKSQATVGFEPSSHWIFLVEGFSTISLRNENLGGADYDLIKIQPSLVFRFNRRWAIQAGASQDISTRNLAPGRSYFISLWSAF
ncbi:hypothetical protein [Hyphococcus sp.]|uniref:hypothetical protein n=1 Tax=Hyphococcus sp. TaxID=2038636 RepID=UPI00375156A8